MIALLFALTALQSAPAPSPARKLGFPPMPQLAACTIPGQSKVATSLSELPAGVRAEIERFFKPDHGIADANGQFNSSDAITDLSIPQRRFLRAYQVGTTWILWYEIGGVVLQRHTIALFPSHDRDAAPGTYEIQASTTFSGNLCAANRAIIDGARSTGP
jgi:hypothetical protein